MKTYTLRAKDIDKRWRVVDAEGRALGRVATEIADALRGKDKPTFTPHLDMGDFVIVTNASKVKLTGQKASQKLYRHHTG
ncbi:MAG TPA: 50S ribosomal protein L13, partial [Dehalococcoidia bacterium]|nr:50S ribosomal protein L13 [Dehalococcoidia bacterium]